MSCLTITPVIYTVTLLGSYIWPGMKAHLTTRHFTYLNTCVATAFDDVQMSYLWGESSWGLNYEVADYKLSIVRDL